MTVKEYLESTFKMNDRFNVRNAVTCVDGFSVSIQGGTDFHYCTPRRLCNVYERVELGFPSELDDTISKYAESEGTTDTVFANVPIGVVERLISKHGGIK